MLFKATYKKQYLDELYNTWQLRMDNSELRTILRDCRETAERQRLRESMAVGRANEARDKLMSISDALLREVNPLPGRLVPFVGAECVTEMWDLCPDRWIAALKLLQAATGCGLLAGKNWIKEHMCE